MSFLSTLSQHRCYCLYDCECNKVGKLISDWTSQEAFETVKKRLLNLTDPTEIFARFACILFYREILDGTLLKCKRDNLRKSAIAFSFASSFANEEIECSTFYATCWERFHELATELDEELKSNRLRHRMPLLYFIEFVFPMEFAERNCDIQLNSLPDAPAASAPNATYGQAASILQPRQSEQSGADVSQAALDSGYSPVLSLTRETANGVVTIKECKVEEQTPQAHAPPRSATIIQAPVVANVSTLSKSPNPQAFSRLEKTDNAETKQEPADPAEGDVDQSATPVPTASVTFPTQPTKTVKRSPDRDGCDGETQKKRVRLSLPLMNVGTSSGTASTVATTTVSENGWHKCPIAGCKLTLKFEWMINRHVRLHGWKKKIYICDECGMEFCSSLALRYHANVHNRTNRFECPECDYHFGNQKHLSRHNNDAHDARQS